MRSPRPRHDLAAHTMIVLATAVAYASRNWLLTYIKYVYPRITTSNLFATPMPRAIALLLPSSIPFQLSSDWPG